MIVRSGFFADFRFDDEAVSRSIGLPCGDSLFDLDPFITFLPSLERPDLKGVTKFGVNYSPVVIALQGRFCDSNRNRVFFGSHFNRDKHSRTPEAIEILDMGMGFGST